MKIKDINKKIDEKELDSLLSKITRLFRKHWVILLALLSFLLVYKIIYDSYIEYKIKAGNNEIIFRNKK